MHPDPNLPTTDPALFPTDPARFPVDPALFPTDPAQLPTGKAPSPTGLVLPRTGMPVIRPAEFDDVEVIHRFIVELAAAEEFPGQVAARPADVAEALFGARPVAEAVLATVDDEPVGFALFYATYSTIEGRPGLHLEDLYVSPGHRGAGLGEVLLTHLTDLAVRRGCARFEWWVLRTNVPALRFYRRFGAREVDEITVMRLDGDGLRSAPQRSGPR